LNILFKLGLVIIVASLSALCGNTLTVFRGTIGSSLPTVNAAPETYAGVFQFLVSYNYTVSINSNATVEFMVIPFNHMFEQYGNPSDYAITSVVVDNWGKLTFRPDRRGIYALVLKAVDSEVATTSVSILATRVFEWDFFYDSLMIAVVGGALSIAGLVIEKFFKRRRTP
jgi:hypothetical protein